MAITNQNQFVDYCKRRLGWPVIDIDVDDDQVQDRVNDALKKWQEYHFDGVERYYLKHQIVQDDIDNRYIEVTDPLIIGVVRVLPLNQSTMNMFDVRYQVRLNDFYNFNNVQMTHYYMTMNHLSLLDFLFNIVPQMRFNRKDNKIYLEMDAQDATVGTWIVFECYRAVDPCEFCKVWDDQWLEEYATMLIQRQWGANLRKFGGIQLPGAVLLDGDKLYTDAQTNIRRLEDELQDRYSLPPDFCMG